MNLEREVSIEKESWASETDHNLDSAIHSNLRRELTRWQYEVLSKKAVAALEGRGMKAFYAPSRREALSIVMELIPRGTTIGRGDSMTLHEIGLISALTEARYNFVDPYSEEHKHLSLPERIELWREILLCDIFVTGTNALTLEGELVNVDAGGNRVAPLLFGPRKVIVVVGANKLVSNEEEGLKRVREIVAPRNAKRLGYRLPCVKTGICTDCNVPDRICRQVVIIKRDSGDRLYGEPRIHVVIVGEELGL